jgi:membrane protein
MEKDLKQENRLDTLDKLEKNLDKTIENITPLRSIKNMLVAFFNDDTTYYAASLSFYSIFALLPILMVLIAIVASVPIFDNYLNLMLLFIMDFINPMHSDDILDFINLFLSNKDKLGNVGLIYALFVFTMFFKDYEYMVNKIFKIKSRPLLKTLFYYLIFLALIPLLFMTYMAILSIIDLPLLSHTLTFIYVWLMFFWLFKISANTKIYDKSALKSSFMTVISLGLMKYIFMFYVLYNKTYLTIYGSFATLLFFFLWIYVSWIIYLYGIKFLYTLNEREKSLK